MVIRQVEQFCDAIKNYKTKEAVVKRTKREVVVNYKKEKGVAYIW